MFKKLFSKQQQSLRLAFKIYFTDKKMGRKDIAIAKVTQKGGLLTLQPTV